MTWKAVLWKELRRQYSEDQLQAAAYHRRWAQVGITGARLRTMLEGRMPGLPAALDYKIHCLLGRPPNRNESLEHKLFRTIFSGYHDRTKEDPKRRYGFLGPRHPDVHLGLKLVVQRLMLIEHRWQGWQLRHWSVDDPMVDPLQRLY